jgi:ADP-ribose pyrophosphatase YjhB (NUDIX family)
MSDAPKVAQKAILIREDGKILALRRSKTCPRRPLGWDLPGGDVEYGEDLLESIGREVHEETGLVVEKLNLLDAIGFVAPDGEYWVSTCYVARVLQGSTVTISWEHDTFEWLSRAEFLSRESTPRIKRFLQKLKILR